MNIVSIILPLIDVSTGRRGEAEEWGEGGISIAEGVNRRADRNVPRREGRLTLQCVVFPRAGRVAPGSQPRCGADQGRRWPRAEHGEPNPVSPPTPYRASVLAFGSRRFQAAAGSIRCLLTILVHPPSLCNCCRERTQDSALKVTNFSKSKRNREGSSLLVRDEEENRHLGKSSMNWQNIPGF